MESTDALWVPCNAPLPPWLVLDGFEFRLMERQGPKGREVEVCVAEVGGDFKTSASCEAHEVSEEVAVEIAAHMALVLTKNSVAERKGQG